MNDFIDENNSVAYDMGISTLTRINYWLWKANQHCFQDDPIGWFKSLKIVYSELTPFCEMKDIDLKSIEKNYKGYLRYIGKKNTNTFKPPRDIFDDLFDLGIKLRKEADKEGLLMKKQGDINLDDY